MEVLFPYSPVIFFRAFVMSEGTGECLKFAIPDYFTKTLMDAIKRMIVDVIMLFSNCWKGYKSSELKATEYDRLTMNHSNITDLMIGCHT